MKDIILAGDSGTRLNLIALEISKQLAPIYGRPMIYYPLSTLMLARIQDVLIIIAPHDALSFHRLLGDGSQLSVNITYTIQEVPSGLTQIFIPGADHIDTDSATLVLGDNIFYSPSMDSQLRRHVDPDGGAVFAYRMSDPSTYGVIEFNENFTALSVEEKPAKPKSHYAVPGLYLYNNNAVDIAKNLKLPARNEYEITDVSHTHLETGEPQVEVLPHGTTWLGIGTLDFLADATAFVHTVEARQGTKIGASEGVAQRMDFIDGEGLRQRTEPLVKSGYDQYLLDLLAHDDV